MSSILNRNLNLNITITHLEKHSLFTASQTHFPLNANYMKLYEIDVAGMCSLVEPGLSNIFM